MPPKKVSAKHTVISTGKEGQEVKHKEIHQFDRGEAKEENFIIQGNLVHVEGIKRLHCKASKDELNISTEYGCVSIKCSTPTGYMIYKDSDGRANARVMTDEEMDKYVKVAQV